MAQIVIRKLDDAVIERHRQRAKLAGHSLEQELRGVIADAAKMTTEERMSLAKSIRSRVKPVKRPLAEDLIREDRDSR